ncbi:MAG: hypothetical protein U5K37_11580 [Natrialbaceae archaeon]|nr:hypothetical protein [Natrialbaceae archaeon]
MQQRRLRKSGLGPALITQCHNRHERPLVAFEGLLDLVGGLVGGGVRLELGDDEPALEANHPGTDDGRREQEDEDGQAAVTVDCRHVPIDGGYWRSGTMGVPKSVGITPAPCGPTGLAYESIGTRYRG